MSDELAALAARAWDGVTQSAHSDPGPLGEQRRRLVHAARQRSELARLFPWTSMGTLCFSRCSEWPFTTDCPCIGVGQDLQFWVLPDATTRQDGTDSLLRTPDMERALQTVVDHLPQDTSVWIGTREDR